MQDGELNVTKTSAVYTYAGTSLVDRGGLTGIRRSVMHGLIRARAAHSPRFARDHLNAMDEAVKLSFTKYREAMGILMAFIRRQSH